MTNEQIEYINNNWQHESKKKLAEHTGATYNQVEHYMRKNNLRHYKSTPFTQEEIDIIIEVFQNKNITPDEICETIPNHSWGSISKKAQELNIATRNQASKVWKSTYLGYYYNHDGAIHRQVYEQTHNVKLTSNDIVHHKDGNKLNNSPDNLEVMTRAEHINLHRQQLMAAKMR